MNIGIRGEARLKNASQLSFPRQRESRLFRFFSGLPPEFIPYFVAGRE